MKNNYLVKLSWILPNLYIVEGVFLFFACAKSITTLECNK